MNRWVAILAGVLLAFVVVNSIYTRVNAHKISTLEREADARMCARANLTRAEIHVAYQNPQNDPMNLPPGLGDTEPYLLHLLKLSERNRQIGLERVQRFLPILDCSPNLEGEAAKPYPRGKQRKFVQQYKAGKLDPTPEASDADTGPDE